MTRLLTLETLTLAFIAEAAGIDDALTGGNGGEDEEEAEVATAARSPPATDERLCDERERSSNCETNTTLGAEE